MWGKIIIPMYRLWLHGLYGLYGPRCPLSPKRPINLISLMASQFFLAVFIHHRKITLIRLTSNLVDKYIMGLPGLVLLPTVYLELLLIPGASDWSNNFSGNAQQNVSPHWFYHQWYSCYMVLQYEIIIQYKKQGLAQSPWVTVCYHFTILHWTFTVHWLTSQHFLFMEINKCKGKYGEWKC